MGKIGRTQRSLLFCIHFNNGTGHQCPEALMTGCLLHKTGFVQCQRNRIVPFQLDVMEIDMQLVELEEEEILLKVWP